MPKNNIAPETSGQYMKAYNKKIHHVIKYRI